MALLFLKFPFMFQAMVLCLYPLCKVSLPIMLHIFRAKIIPT